MTAVVVTIETPELRALPAPKSKQILDTFLPMYEMVKGFEDAFATVTESARQGITPDVSDAAKALRKDIAKVRIAAEKARVAGKAEYLLAGRAIDGVNNVLLDATTPMEKALEAIEKHAEMAEAARIKAKFDERAALLADIGIVAHPAVGEMLDDVWPPYYAAKLKEYMERTEAARAAAEEEANRMKITERALERVAACGPAFQFLPQFIRDNLKTITDEEYMEARIEAEKAHASHLAGLEAEKAERERLAVVAAKAEADRREESARLAALEKIEAERVATEREAVARSAAASKRAAEAPVKARLSGWVTSFILPELPGEAHPTADAITEKFEAFRAWALRSVEAIGEG